MVGLGIMLISNSVNWPMISWYFNPTGALGPSTSKSSYIPIIIDIECSDSWGSCPVSQKMLKEQHDLHAELNMSKSLILNHFSKLIMLSSF